MNGKFYHSFMINRQYEDYLVKFQEKMEKKFKKTKQFEIFTFNTFMCMQATTDDWESILEMHQQRKSLKK